MAPRVATWLGHHVAWREADTAAAVTQNPERKTVAHAFGEINDRAWARIPLRDKPEARALLRVLNRRPRRQW